MKKISWILCIIILLWGCSTKEIPDHIKVQHILIAFKGSIPKPEVVRTKEEAEVLALDLFARAKKGEDFDALVKEYTDDQHPGIYRMANIDVTPLDNEEFPRSRMIKGFGDVSFQLEVSEIGLLEYDPETSKYGWHIIKRIQ